MPIVFAKPILPPSTDWDISGFSSDGITYTTSQLGPNGVSFKPDGTKMYIASSSGAKIGEYDLSTPWVVNTASPVQTKTVASDPREVILSADGTKAYVPSNSTDLIYQYALSTPWTFDSVSQTSTFDPSETVPTGVYFRSDGIKMYVSGAGGDSIRGFTLGTAWDITSANFDNSFAIGTEETVVINVVFSTTGKRMFISGYSGSVYQYDLTIGWDLTTAAYNGVSAALGLSRPSVAFKSDGTKMYAMDDTTQKVYQYSL